MRGIDGAPGDDAANRHAEPYPRRVWIQTVASPPHSITIRRMRAASRCWRKAGGFA